VTPIVATAVLAVVVLAPIPNGLLRPLTSRFGRWWGPAVVGVWLAVWELL
jgi:hypothetical protein